VVDAWYLSGYEPIRDSRGRAVGILYVGVLERRYLDVRNRALAILLLLTVPALGLLLSGAWLVARSVTRPLGSLAAAAQAVARGQLDLRISPGNGGLEVDYLARAFESMVNAVREREARLTSQNLELEAANRDYGELLDFVTHELNNSIGSLLLNTSILADESGGALGPEQREIVDQLMRDISRVRDMVRNYLSLSRLERGSLGSYPSPIEVRTGIIEPVLKRLDRWIRHAAFRVDWDWPREVTISADADLLDTCFSNLVVNALKYGRDWIRFSAEREGAGWRIAIANGGAPIPPDKVGLLFRKFSRLVASDDGAGLGLYLVRTIVERQGGRVWCESEKATTFVLWMPAP
jgi:signal transduction histidine kinase